MSNKHNTYVFYYARLDDEERRVYLQLLHGLEEHAVKVDVDPVCCGARIKTLLDCVQYDNPVIGYYGKYTMHLTPDKRVCAVEFDYYLSKEKQQQLNEAMLEQANMVADYARSKGESVRDRVKAVHEYLVQGEYDYDFKPYSYSPAGALLYGRTVCKGVALAFKLILDILGINSICLRGKYGDGGHAWNQVFYNGKYNFMDVTFNMCETKNGKISYKSFERSDNPEKYKEWEMFRAPKQKG